MRIPKNNIEDRQLIDTLQSVELAEGVEVQTRVAGVFPRAIALLIDMAIMFGAYIVILLLLGLVASILLFDMAGGYRLLGVYLILMFLMLWFYHFVFERGLKAASPGKRMMGLKVVSVDGTRATPKKVFIRNILRAADVLPGAPLAFFIIDPELQTILYGSGIGMMLVGSYGVGLLACLFTKRFQRVGDLVAGTVVVHADTPIHAVAPLPPAIKGRIPRLPIIREEEVAIRSFCERAGIWSEARRVEMAQQAGELTGKQGVQAVEELQAYSRWIAESK